MASREHQLRVLGVVAGYTSIRAICVAAGIDRTSLTLTLKRGRAPRPATIDKLTAVLGVQREVVARIFARGDS